MTVSPPISDTDRELAAILRNVAQVPTCEHGIAAGKPCGEKATSVLVSSCGHDNFYCAEHRARVEKWLESNTKPKRGRPTHLHCADPRPPMHEPFTRVTVEWRSL